MCNMYMHMYMCMYMYMLCMCMHYMSRVDSGQPNVTQMSQASGWTAAAMSTALAGATIASLRLIAPTTKRDRNASTPSRGILYASMP